MWMCIHFLHFSSLTSSRFPYSVPSPFPLIHLFLSSFPSCLISFTISHDFMLIDRWELAMCKHFTHPFASHHPWHQRFQTPCTPTGPLHIAISAVSCIFTVGRWCRDMERQDSEREGVWTVVGPVYSLTEGHLSRWRGVTDILREAV